MKNQRFAIVVCTSLLVLALLTPATHPSFSTVSVSSSDPENVKKRPSSGNFAKPIVYHPDALDRDFNGVQDSLESMISQRVAANRSAVFPVVVTLYNPVTSQDLEWFTTLDGQVTKVYRYVTYGFGGTIPGVNLPEFASLEKENLCVIEYDAPIRYHLDVSVPLIRARPIVWDTYGYMGSPSHSIAIIDTGIDDSHSDVGPFGDLNFSRKIVGWYDATADGAVAPQDYGEHGTHCAGIAAGTGAANPLQTSGFATNTLTDSLSGLRSGWGYLYYGFDVMTPGLITLTCTWTSSNTVVLQLRDVTGNTILAGVQGSQKPLVLTYNAAQSGRYRPFVGIGGAGEQGSGYFSLRETFPYQGRNDGHNLFTGVAPDSKLVGVKVFDNSGSGTSSTLMAGMDWVIQNRLTYHIVVASMSLSLENGATDTTLDQKADTMVENGIVTCVSAGNNFPSYTIGSPGTAAHVITVGATNDQNGITSYSSNGDTAKNEYGLIKPDVVAPGGSTGAGNLITSADSNDVDYGYSGQSDYTSNDYQQFGGTSMSAPHVAGLAALMTDALSSWSWAKDEVLKLKMIISMTSFETHSGEGTNVPPLNRGGKDNKEGYGRISADASIEAVTMNYNIGGLANATLGPSPSDKKVWARRVTLSANTTYEFSLSVPSGADYDLFLYDGNPDTYGQPLLLEKSVNASQGVHESLLYTPTHSGIRYLVVKWVGGGGMFNLTSSFEKHDLAVTSVAASATAVYGGEEVSVTVVVKNEGTTSETFQVKVCYNSTTIGAQTVVDLASDASVTLTFAWTTEGVPYGKYIISATAIPVPHEADLADNSSNDGLVHVKIRGDVDGDGLVNILDAGQISAHWYPGPPVGPLGFDSNADINKDGRVDIVDLAIINGNWLKSEKT